MLLIFCRYIIFVVEFSPLCFPLWVELHSEPTLSRPKNWLFGRFLGFEPDTLQPGHNIFYDSTFGRDKPQGLAPCQILLFPVLDGADATVNVRFLCQIYIVYSYLINQCRTHNDTSHPVGFDAKIQIICNSVKMPILPKVQKSKKLIISLLYNGMKRSMDEEWFIVEYRGDPGAHTKVLLGVQHRPLDMTALSR